MPQLSRMIVMFCACFSSVARSLSAAAWPAHDAQRTAAARIECFMTRDCATEIHRPRDVRRAQAAEHEDILNVGGFSDQVFDIGVCRRTAGRRPLAWAARIGRIVIEGTVAVNACESTWIAVGAAQ